jgi:hypothetical protein
MNDITNKGEALAEISFERKHSPDGMQTPLPDRCREALPSASNCANNSYGIGAA